MILSAEKDTNKSSELVVDIVIGGLGEVGESVSSMAQKALLKSFKATANLDAGCIRAS